MCRNVGAPRGGRVHWLLWNLRKDFAAAYHIKYNYARHSYLFCRYIKRDLFDTFSVVRTSRRCWRCIYCCPDCGVYEYFSTYTSKQMALRMWLLYQKYRDREE